jgi:acyl-CoA thioesterase I
VNIARTRRQGEVDVVKTDCIWHEYEITGGKGLHMRYMGGRWRLVELVFAAVLGSIVVMSSASAESIRITALGDSLTAGYGLDDAQGFTRQLEAALKAKGHDVVIINAGVSGDTVAQGQARLDWVLSEPTQGVIVELGANDALRGLDPAQAEESLRKILSALGDRHLPVLIAGMQAPPNLGADYVAKFNGIYPKLADEFEVQLYPFFLDGVAGNVTLVQADGLHPTAEGVAIIVAKITPFVEKLLGEIEAQK